MVLLNEKTDHFTEIILNWWDTKRKNFPWRKTDNPYQLLITEILLRKTTSKQVNSIYNEFFKKYPKIPDLVKADQKDLQKLLYPLGMEKKI